MSICVTGGKILSGELRVQGSKNSALPILAATLLADSPTTLYGVPSVSDVHHMCSALRLLGCTVTQKGSTVTVDPQGKKFATLVALQTVTRGITLFMGACLGAFGKCDIVTGGGCKLGSRPIDYHLQGFGALGARVLPDFVDGSHIVGGDVYLPFPSVGATQNILLASVRAPGQTVIHGAAREPEICDLIKYLCLCGAKITGMGTPTLTVQGVKNLKGICYPVMPDRCAAATYLLMCAATGGSIRLLNVTPFMLYNVLSTFMKMGIDLDLRYDSIFAKAHGLKGIGNLTTGVHPGFPTDMQPLVCAALTAAAGETAVHEQVFLGRFAYIPQLNSMGAGILCRDSQNVLIPGGAKLQGTEVLATDLRGGAALALGALLARGTTKILNTHHIDRGYENFAQVLMQLGADITTCEDDTYGNQEKNKKEKSQKTGETRPVFKPAGLCGSGGGRPVCAGQHLLQGGGGQL